ncbi:hypothetical protein H312_01148 [Anncaliia algerae PRA339]|uniref:Tc1-like transposase DDE domain-containing protein n=1 Tax=Anncaliia algerae PRA339 TaxID=1288291 RepID=A0A059F275_9MICR|nr:hypothetical protein H312_01148 [Anncaliia algerae PRA339]
MDNCKLHWSITVRQALSDPQVLVQYLPAYSPQLNPVEEFFSTLKTITKGEKDR